MSTTPADDRNRSRVRRPADALGLIASVAALAVILFVAHTLPTGTAELTASVAQAFRHLPRVFVVACAGAAALGTVVLVVLVVIDLARDRRTDLIVSGVSAAVATVVGIFAVVGFHAFRGGVSAGVLHGTDGSMLARDGVLVAFLVGADVVRQGRFTRHSVLAVVALLLTGLALGDLTPDAVLIAPIGGYAAGLAPRLVFGATVRHPSIATLRNGLGEAGFELGLLERAPSRSRDLTGSLADGTPVLLKMAGREMLGADALRRLWAITRLRGAALGHQPVGLRRELETEALTSFLAAGAGIPVPKVFVLADFEPDTLVLLRERDIGPALSGSSPACCAEESFRMLRRLHTIGVGHRDLRAVNLVATDGRVALRSLDSAVAGASTSPSCSPRSVRSSGPRWPSRRCERATSPPTRGRSPGASSRSHFGTGA